MTGDNYKFVCPFHVSDPPGKKKLEVNIETQKYKCWTCSTTNNSKGKTIKSLFKKMGVNEEFFNELKLVVPNIPSKKTEEYSVISLPKEFIGFDHIPKDKIQSIQLKQAYQYLKTRKLNKYDILKYNIGLCLEGKYENRIIIPSYNSYGNLNYFIARDFTEAQHSKYKNPPVKNKDIIAMEFYVNWNLPIILCEGIFDALTLKRNTIPLIGKNISEALYKKIVTSQVKQIYVCLDKDALNESLKYCEEFIRMGKQTYLVEIEGKDINEIGFKKFLDVLENTSPFTFQDLIIRKLNK